MDYVFVVDRSGSAADEKYCLEPFVAQIEKIIGGASLSDRFTLFAFDTHVYPLCPGFVTIHGCDLQVIPHLLRNTPAYSGTLPLGNVIKEVCKRLPPAQGVGLYTFVLLTDGTWVG